MDGNAAVAERKTHKIDFFMRTRWKTTQREKHVKCGKLVIFISPKFLFVEAK
jgi:hypothetical protein